MRPAASLWQTLMNTTTPKMTLGKYLLTATRGEDEVLRQRFNDPDDADRAVAEALVRYPDCEIRLIWGYTVLLSAGPPASAQAQAGDEPPPTPKQHKPG